MEYLSDAWLDAMAGAAMSCPAADPAEQQGALVIETVVHDVPGDGETHEVRFHLRSDENGISLERGAAPDCTVRMSQSYATAAAIATGRRSAQEAFLAGDLRLGGDATALVRASTALAALDAASEPIRAKTRVTTLPDVNLEP